MSIEEQSGIINNQCLRLMFGENGKYMYVCGIIMLERKDMKGQFWLTSKYLHQQPLIFFACIVIFSCGIYCLMKLRKERFTLLHE